MVYNAEDTLRLLEEYNIIVQVEGGYTINKRYASTNRSEKFCINFPSDMEGVPDNIIYKRVIEDCRIPIMYRGDLSYFLRTQTKESLKELKEIIRNPEVDYTIFVKSVRRFYNSGIPVPGFAKFLVKQQWRTVYDDDQTNMDMARDTKGLF